MADPLSKTLNDIRKEAEGSGMRIFYGYLAEENHVPTVYWNRENGGDWKKFFVCARTLRSLRGISHVISIRPLSVD